METPADLEITPDLADFMTGQEAASKIGVHPASIAKLIRQNLLEGMRFDDRWYVSRKSVDRYLKSEDGGTAQ